LGFDSVAGARLPYAIAGTLSVAATAAAGAAVAGPWGAAAAAALLAFAPHHVHFSRLSSVMILDALFAPLLVFLLLALRRNGSPRVAVLAGVAAGLALYGYSGGRAITVVFLLTAPIVAFRSPASGRARWLLLAALLLGFLAAAGPNLQFAIQRFDQWNGRFDQVGVLSAQWWKDAKPHFGPPASIVSSQFALGTVGLLSTKDMTTWFAGYPLIGPALLVALAFAGLGWLFGRRQILPVAILLLLAGANVAGVVLTSGAPAPQRASSLLPMLSILGGAAVAGSLALVPESAGRVRWRALAGAVFVTAYLVETGARRPFSPDSSPDYTGPHGTFSQAMLALMRMPRWQSEPTYLYGIPYLSSDLPTFQYALGPGRIKDVDPAGVDAQRLPPGLHFFAPEFEALGRQVRDESGRRGFALAHPVDPLRNVGYLVRVPAARPVGGS
jgi:4-amino-4-deoxy-L-arabinose transferase-like glycosyltransferase